MTKLMGQIMHLVMNRGVQAFATVGTESNVILGIGGMNREKMTNPVASRNSFFPFTETRAGHEFS